MSLQNLTLTTLRNSLPDSLVDEVINDLQSKVWIVSTVGENPVSGLVSSEDPIQSMVRNEIFVKQLLSFYILDTYTGFEEVFVIFKLTRELTWTQIKNVLTFYEARVRFQNPLDPRDNFEISVADIESDHIYSVESNDAITEDEADDLLEFIVDRNTDPKVATWIELFLMNDEDQADDLETAKIQEKSRNRKKLYDVNFSQLESYTVPKLRGFLKRIDIKTKNKDKSELILILKSATN